MKINENSTESPYKNKSLTGLCLHCMSIIRLEIKDNGIEEMEIEST